MRCVDGGHQCNMVQTLNSSQISLQWWNYRSQQREETAGTIARLLQESRHTYCTTVEIKPDN